MDNKTNLINAQMDLLEVMYSMLKEANKTVKFSDKVIGRYAELCQRVEKERNLVFTSDETAKFLINDWANMVFNTEKKNEKNKT